MLLKKLETALTSSCALLQMAQNPGTDANTSLGIARNNATSIAGLTAVVRHSNVNATILDVAAEHQNANRALLNEISARRANFSGATGSAISWSGKQSSSYDIFSRLLAKKLGSAIQPDQ